MLNIVKNIVNCTYGPPSPSHPIPNLEPQKQQGLLTITGTDLAKVSPHVLDPARFGLHLGVHLLSRYAHFTAAFVTVEQLRWARIGTGTGSDGGAGGIELSEHKHAFWRDGTEKRFVEVEVARKRDGDGAVARVAGGLRDLLGALMSRFFPPAHPIPSLDVGLSHMPRTYTIANRFVVLKSTGSAFENFVRDEYTTLVEVDDRIFSTSVDLRYTYGEVGVKLGPRGDHEDSEGRKGLGVINFGEENFDKRGTGAVHPWEDAKVGARARETTLDVFAHDESASVQVRRMRGNEGCRRR
jgi:urate oxidase